MHEFHVGDRVSVTGYKEATEGLIGSVLGYEHPYYKMKMDKPHPLWGAYPSNDIAYMPANKLLPHVEPAPVVETKPTLATAIGLEPLTRRILAHIEKRGSITPMEALSAYGCFRLAAQVFKLRSAGFKINTTNRVDEAGHRYARYSLATA